MDFLTSTIMSGILYDLIKKGIKLSFGNVFINNSNNLDHNICEEFLEEINQINDENDKLECSNKLLAEENKYTLMFEKNMYTTNFSKRLDYIIALMNDCGYWGHKINLEKMGEFLGFNSVNPLKKYYFSTEEPDYAFIDNMAVRLGINAKWMKFGFGEPFESSLPVIYSAKEILFEKDFNDVNEFIFVIDDEPYRKNLGVIRKLSDYKYDYFSHTFIFHADVGATGASELFSVYVFLYELNKKRLMPSGVYKVTQDQFYQLFKGRVYTGTIKKYRTDSCPYLLDDFLSLYRTEEEKERYVKLYGKVFVDCQDIIKYKLTQN